MSSILHSGLPLIGSQEFLSGTELTKADGTIHARKNLPLIGSQEFHSGTELEQADCTILARRNLPLIRSQEFLPGTERTKADCTIHTRRKLPLVELGVSFYTGRLHNTYRTALDQEPYVGVGLEAAFGNIFPHFIL